MGSSDSSLGVCANIFRVLFVIVNAFFVLVGIGILGGGIYLVVTTQNYEVITGSSNVSGSALIITAGVVTLFIAGIGCVGALFKWRPLLAIYAIIVAFIIILEIVAAIVGFHFSGKLEDRYRDNWEMAITDYSLTDDKSDTNRAVDFLQENLQCCGLDGPVDWGTNNPGFLNETGDLPQSCDCDDENDDTCRIATFTYTVNGSDTIFTSSGTVWNDGCYNHTVNLGRAVGITIGSIGLVVGISEVASVIVAAGLIFCITRGKSEYQVV